MSPISAAHHAGPAGSGAALKLVVNAFLGIQVAALGELLGAAERMGLDRRRAGEVLIEMPSCSASAKGVTLAMLARNFAPAFPVELVEKDLGYLASEAQETTPVSASARAVFARAISAGLAADNMTAVAKLYEEMRPPQDQMVAMIDRVARRCRPPSALVEGTARFIRSL